MDISDSLMRCRPGAPAACAAPDLEQRLRDLEAGLRAGAIHRQALEGHLAAPLDEPEAIEIRWMLLGLEIIEQHRYRLIQRLEARRAVL